MPHPSAAAHSQHLHLHFVACLCAAWCACRFRTCFCSKGAACDRPMCFFAHSEYDLRVVGPSVSAPLVSPGTDTPPALSPLTSADITLDAGLLATLLALQPPITTPTAAAAAVAPQQLARSPQGSPPVQLSPIRVAPAVQPSQLAGAADAASLGVIDRLLASANLISPGGGGGGGGGGTSGTGSSYHSSAPPSSSGGNTSRSVSPGLAPLSPGAALAAAAAGGYAVLPGMVRLHGEQRGRGGGGGGWGGVVQFLG